MDEQTRWSTIVGTALISSFITAVVTEPVKVWLMNSHRKRLILRSVLMEASRNVSQGQNMLDVYRQGGFLGPAGAPVTQQERDVSFCRTVASVLTDGRYQAAQTEMYLYYSLEESDWLDDTYHSWARFKADPPFGVIPPVSSPADVLEQINLGFIACADRTPRARKYLLKIGTPYVRTKLREMRTTRWHRFR